MMTKWYPRRDFSIKTPLSFQKRFSTPLQDQPPADTLFWEMWKECEDIAKAVLETDYFMGITVLGNGNFDFYGKSLHVEIEINESSEIRQSIASNSITDSN